MPYIKRHKRPAMDPIVDLMIDLDMQVDGDLNYVLYAFCKRYVAVTYNRLKNYCGELRQCATEIERTILGPLEDEKRKDNGDIF